MQIVRPIKFLKYIFGTIAVMTFLLFVLLMSLRLDSVQRGLALYVTDEIAGSYGIPIEVEAVDVRGFNDLRLKKVLVRDLAGDTMIYADEARAYLQTAKLLKGKGHFFMVHRPSRLVDIFYFCRKHGLEPKDIRYVVPKVDEIPNIVLIHCTSPPLS